MPRKIAGSEMITIEELIVAISIPRVVLDSATHLYRSPTATGPSVRPAGIQSSSRAPKLTLT